jgi:hypothetical protein
MSKKHLSGLSLRSGALVFSLFTALAACATGATPQRGLTPAATIKPSQAAWGYPIGAASSEPEVHSAAKATQPAPTLTCGHQPSAPRVAAQTSC